MVRKVLALTFLLIVAGSPVRAAEPGLAYGAAGEVEMSADVLRAGLSLFREAVENDELQGAVLLVARRGVIVLHEAVGWRDPSRSPAPGARHCVSDGLQHKVRSSLPVYSCSPKKARSLW